MQPNVKKDILNVIKDSLKAIYNNDIKQLSDISNHTIHDSTLLQDKEAISIAVIIYSLSKIFQKHKYEEYKDWKFFYRKIIELLKKAEHNLKNNQLAFYNQDIKQILKLISKLENKFSLFITHVINQARIKKGSKIYEHGLSIGTTANLLNITPWELMSYIGQTNIAEQSLKTKSIKERLDIARSLFT